MISPLKARWRAFFAVPRGERFQAHHHRAHRANTSRWTRIAVIVASLVLLATGIALLVLPGPGLLFLLAGGALLAAESLLAARILDWLDLAAANAVRRWRARRTRRRSEAAP